MKKLIASLMVAATLAVGFVPTAEAKYGGSRSSFSTTRVYSSPRPSFSRPAPMPSYRPAPVPSYRSPTVINRSTTVIQQAPQRGTGFFGNMLSTGAGVLGGMALFNWLKPEPKPQAVPLCTPQTVTGTVCTPAAPVAPAQQ